MILMLMDPRSGLVFVCLFVCVCVCGGGGGRVGVWGGGDRRGGPLYVDMQFSVLLRYSL